MLWSLIIQGGYLFIVYWFFGYVAFVFVLGAAITGFLLLETVNYIEHYGLLRLKNESGKSERVKEVHSWNSDHVVGRIILYELTRHSDHHFKSTKKYQTLKFAQFKLAIRIREANKPLGTVLKTPAQGCPITKILRLA